MKICICRNIGETDLAQHLDENPHLLGKTWRIVSKDLHGKDMQCGKCEEMGETCLKNIEAAAPSSP